MKKLYYLPKSVNYDRTINNLYKDPDNSSTEEVYFTEVNLESIGIAFVKLFISMAEDFYDGGLKTAEDYKLNLYDLLKIEDFSFISPRYLGIINDSIARNMNSPLVQEKNLFKDLNFFTIETQPENLFMHGNTDANIDPTQNNYNAYKIHLMVKPEYIAYAFLKLILNMKYYEFNGKIYYFSTKMNLNSRSHMPNLPTDDSPGNIALLSDESNGGSSPTIIIYPGANPQKVIDMINTIFRIFEGEHEKIGLMNDIFGKPQHVPTFNVRLTPLLAYALGDRVKKLDDRIKTKALKEKGTVKEQIYDTPEWLHKEAEHCSTHKDEVNSRGQYWFGRNICDGVDNLDFNYIGIKDTPMVSPYQLLDFKTGGRKAIKTQRKHRKRKTRKNKN